LLKFLFIIPLLLSTLSVSALPSAKAEHSTTIRHLANMYQSSMAYIFKAQPQINRPQGDKSALFGQPFIDNVKLAYQAKFKQPFPAIDHPLKEMLLQVMIEVMEDNRTLLYDQDISYKGFIPAIFAFQLSEKLSTKGLGVKFKFTSSPNMIRNQLNLPDSWEELIIDKVKMYQLSEYLDAQAIYQGKPATRYFVPVKVDKFCLNCHGSPQDNPLNSTKPQSQWSNVDVTGFVMENWKMGDFGGGVSVVIYEK
jgi:hypothetical protein